MKTNKQFKQESKYEMPECDEMGVVKGTDVAGCWLFTIFAILALCSLIFGALLNFIQ